MYFGRIGGARRTLHFFNHTDRKTAVVPGRTNSVLCVGEHFKCPKRYLEKRNDEDYAKPLGEFRVWSTESVVAAIGVNETHRRTVR